MMKIVLFLYSRVGCLAIVLASLTLLTISSCSKPPEEKSRAHEQRAQNVSNEEGPDPLVVAFISHTYYVNRHPDMQQMIIDQINAAKPTFVFALGDIVLLNKDHLWEETLSFFSKIKSQVMYSPGNHDIFNFDVVEGLMTDRHYPKWREEYLQRIGYVHNMIQHPLADFILVNSNDPFDKIKPHLDKSLAAASEDTPTILLTHHRVWLERRQDNWIHWYWKSASREDFLPYFDRFDHMVIGDLWGKLEHKYIEGTPTTMIGMGNNDKPAFWVLAKIKNDWDIEFEKKTIELPEGHPYIYKKK